MKLAGFLLLLAGWLLVLSAVVLLKSAASRTTFVMTGVCVQILGLVLVARFHPLLRGESR